MQSCSVRRLSWVRIRRILLQHSLLPFRWQSCSRPCCLCNHKLINNRRHKLLAREFSRVRLEMLSVRNQLMRLNLHRRKMSTHALQKMTRDLLQCHWLRGKNAREMLLRWKEQWRLFLAVTALQFLATVRDQKLFWSKVWRKCVL